MYEFVRIFLSLMYGFVRIFFNLMCGPDIRMYEFFKILVATLEMLKYSLLLFVFNLKYLFNEVTNHFPFHIQEQYYYSF